MAAEPNGTTTGEPKVPKDVGHVDVEIVGVDDVSRGGSPDRPPGSEISRLMAAVGFVLVPVAAYSLAVPELAADTFLRAAALQSIGLWVLIVALFVIPCGGPVLAIGAFVGAVWCATRVWRGEYVRIPIIWQIVRHWM